MVFNSLEFAIFLPIVFILYWFVFNRNLKSQNLFVVAASYVFYGWWDWRFLFLIAFTSTCSWVSGLLIERWRNNAGRARFVNVANIVINLCVLGAFKYYNFFVQSFADVFLNGNSEGLLLKIILPVGISFYTFQALSYSIDVYRKKLEPTKDILAFFAFVSFFPQLVAGPIERATNLLPQFLCKRSFEYDEAVDGLRQMLWGLFKKVVVADNCAEYVNQIFSSYQTQPGGLLFIGAVLFSFQIYGDFSGYSDLAIGSSKLFGIKLMRNFNVPYFSRDIAEFWRRWHISLTTWFRDYIYIPLGGSRCSKAKIVRNTFIIFLVSGFWHGADWTFIAWGGYHALLFLPLILMGKNRKYTNIVAEDRVLPNVKEVAQILLTFVLVTVGWIIFRSDSISQAVDYIGRLFSIETLKVPYLCVMQPDVRKRLAMVFIMLVVEWFQRRNGHGLYMPDGTKWWVRYGVYTLMMALIVISWGTNQTFIYFQF